MNNFICLLRGINVSGKNLIKMADLRVFLENLGLKNVQTYIQSGNIVFWREDEAKSLEKRIKDGIEAYFGMTVSVQVLTAEELKQAVENCPFDASKLPHNRLLLAFLDQKPTKSNLEALFETDFDHDELIIKNKVAYLHCPDGHGKSKLSNNFLESKLKVTATTRNWRTVMKLLEMVG